MTRKLNYLRLPVRVLSALLILIASVLFAAPAFAAGSTTIVISQVYGAGGNGGAPATGSPYTSDYVELFNLSATAQTLTGWSLQYASATSTAAISTANTFAIPTVTIPAGGYYLISGMVTANGGVADPSDLQTLATLSATAGRVYLVNTTTSLSAATVTGAADPTVVDFVGYGTTAATYEGTGPAPAPGTLLYDQRINICTD